MGKIRIAIVGVGNCASSLLQGIEQYRQWGQQSNGKEAALGLMNLNFNGYALDDIEVVAAFDIDARKVGKPLHEAIFALPNCTMTLFKKMPPSKIKVTMGPVLDGIAAHMSQHPKSRTFVPAKVKPADVTEVLRQNKVDILVNYLPVGSQKATEHYVEACLATGVSLINCMPVFIVSTPKWAKRFEARGIPCVGDDIKAQVGATVVHRTLTQLFEDRGVKLDRTYQLNTGGNTDFLNMLEQERLASKRISKTEAIQSVLKKPLPEEDIHIGPSGYVPWQNDNKVCFMRMEGRGFGGAPIQIELRLSVEDSPNSAGMAVDAIRSCKLARDRKIGGPLYAISAYTMKHPPRQYPDHVAFERVKDFVAGKRDQ